MNPSGVTGTIPNYAISGGPQAPQVLSNKLVLTPINPGNQRGAIWSESVLSQQSWTADVEFRATGPERGGGNLGIWLVRNGDQDVGASSIYTANRFDGLALVVDMHGGSGGMIRGFLNDGNTDYNSHHNVDELAFGHCLYSYRNLGRPTQIKLRQTRDSFRVDVDSKLCFETDTFSIPGGNKFGITAATPEDNPDSFEIFKLAVMSEMSGSDNYQYDSGRSKQRSPSRDTPRRDPPSRKGQDTDDEKDFDDSIMEDEDPDVFQTSRTQFQDLHNRLQSTMHQISAVFRTVSKIQSAEARHNGEVVNILNDINDKLSSVGQVGELQKRIGDLEKEVRSMRNDLSRKIQANERNFKGILTDHHATLSQTLIDSLPGHKRLFLVVVGTQVLLVAAYVVYKRRRASSPKKYL